MSCALRIFEPRQSVTLAATWQRQTMQMNKHNNRHILIAGGGPPSIKAASSPVDNFQCYYI